MRSERLKIRRLRYEKWAAILFAVIFLVMWFRAETRPNTDRVPTRTFMCFTAQGTPELGNWTLGDESKIRCDFPSDVIRSWELTVS